MHLFAEQRQNNHLRHKKRPLRRRTSLLLSSFTLTMLLNSEALAAQELSDFLKVATEFTGDGKTLTLQLTRNAPHSTPEHTARAPLGNEHIPGCQKLIHSLHAIFPAHSGNVQYHCIKSAAPRQGATIAMDQAGDIWKIKTLDWYDDGIILHADFDGSESFSQNRFTRFSQRHDKLPPTTWQWLTNNYTALGNGALASWHSYEVISHSLHLIHDLQTREWGWLVLNILSTLFHAMEGMEHAHHAGLGQYIHTDFHGDIVEASSHPHATNIGLAGVALSLNIIELLSHQHHHHNHSHGQLHTLLNSLHTGLHIHELGYALNSWWYGHPAHEHEHSEHSMNVK